MTRFRVSSVSAQDGRTSVRLSRRGEAAVLAVAAVGAFVAGATAQRWDPYTHGVDRCQSVTLPEDVNGTGDVARHAERLLAAGWYGDPNDHAERLYSPFCAR